MEALKFSQSSYLCCLFSIKLFLGFSVGEGEREKRNWIIEVLNKVTKLLNSAQTA